MLFVVTDPLMQVSVKTDAELRSIITQREWNKIAKMEIGETLDFRRDFGNRVLKVTRTQRNPRPNKTMSRAKPLDSVAAHELYLFAVNDAQLYQTRIIPIIANLKKKIRKGIYNPQLARKLWRYAADDAAKRYAKEYGGSFTVATRQVAADEMAEHFAAELMERNPRKRGYGSVQFTSRGKVARSKWASRRATPGVMSSARRALGRKVLRKMKKSPMFKDRGLTPRMRLKDAKRMRRNPAPQYGKPAKRRAPQIPQAQAAKQVFVQCERGGSWKTVAIFRDTPEMREMAKRFALTYKKKHLKENVRVVKD